jgi:hypothetical protein
VTGTRLAKPLTTMVEADAAAIRLSLDRFNHNVTVLTVRNGEAHTIG